MTQKEKEPKKVGSTKTEKEVFKKKKKKQEGLPSIKTTSRNEKRKKKKKPCFQTKTNPTILENTLCALWRSRKKKKYAANSA